MPLTLNTSALALTILLVSGCGLTNSQIVTTKSFGSATESVGELTESEFTNIRNSIIEMNKELIAIDNTLKANSLIFDKPTYVEPTTKRIAASKAIKSYGELLSKLVTEDRTDGLQKAASSLINNTSAALEEELPEENKKAISKIIVGLGSFWIEKKKADITKEIVLAYQEPVDKLADLLIQDFSLDSLGYMNAYMTTAQRLKNSAMGLINDGSEYSVLERDRAVKAYALAEANITRATELDKKAKKSILSLKKANKELAIALNKKDYSAEEVKKYVKEIHEIVNAYQVLGN